MQLLEINWCRQRAALLSAIALLGWISTAGLLHAATYFSPPASANYPSEIRAGQPPGLDLKLSFSKNHFFQGEEIPATLTFSNKSSTPYHACSGVWDRSREVMRDIAFYAESDKGERVPDPVAWYLERSMGMDGGGGSMVNLGQWSMTVPANQWLRFDHPGVYRIHVWSDRVQTGKFVDFEHLSGSNAVQLVSNQVTITIEPRTPQEEESVLTQARQVINEPQQASFMSSEASERVTAELYRLCALQSPAARAELFPFLAEGNGDTGRLVALGILGAPDPESVAPAFVAAVEEGKPILNEFAVGIYTALKTHSFQGVGPFLNMITITPNPNPPSPLQLAIESAKKEITDAAKKGSGGQGPVFAGALWAAFQESPQDPSTRAALAQHQLEMSADQRKLLISAWHSEVWEDSQTYDPGVMNQVNAHRQGGLDFLPVLLKSATAPDFNPYALTILCKLRPDLARPLVIEDILREKSRVLDQPRTHFSTPVGLDALPDKPIPELTETFRKKLTESGTDPGLVLPLIDRYGTSDLLPDVLLFYKSHAGAWECVVENACLRFWIRCDPQMGLKALESSLHSRKETRCYATMLEEVFKDRWIEQAQPSVVKSLNDPDSDFVLSAIKTLQIHGNQDCVESVIAALERIYATPPPQIPDEEPLEIQRRQQTSLAGELLKFQRWNYSPEQKNRLAKIADAAN